ncbi:MAG TPA: hypothetical protein VD996_07140 [Chitinophagaceae bacterium]|nr:hypothetical protein [Chitinophagaceae bacterium]
MRCAIILLSICISTIAAAQTPFATFKTTKPLTVDSARKLPQETRLMLNILSDINSEHFVNEVKQHNKEQKDSLKLEYFDHLSANAVFIQNSQKMFPTINGEVINYRLGIWTEKRYISKSQCADCDTLQNRIARRICRENRRRCLDTTADELRTHYLPFSIITKISSNYADSSAGPTHDATSFFGAPLTLRFSPAFDLTPHLEENKLFAGINTDLRLLTYTDTVANDLETAWGAYVSAGLSYLGKGYAYETDEADRHDGAFSFSAMLYWFKSGGQFNKELFGNYQKKTLTGVEIILRFKTSSKQSSRFNFILGASNGFTRGAPNFAKWQFQLGVGT